jgi:L-aspartate oxidase
MNMTYDDIIVGTGAAGLFAALHLPEDHEILMITKDTAENSDSYLAQGGICCARGEDDFDAFFEDTMKAGHYMNDPAAVRNMIENSQAVNRELISYGVEFDKDRDGSYAFTREGGHSKYRILHHMDVTGKEICTKLLAEVRRRPNIDLREHFTMLDLLVADGRCCGITAADSAGTRMRIFASNVVLATGGIGGLFRRSSNFRHITGDGIAAACRKGVRLRHLDFIQIHPTVLYTNEPGRAFLISESVRGEGAKLLNENGERFTDELMPRDIVSSAIKAEMDRFGTDHVYLSFDDIPDREIKTHFRNIYEHCLEEGYDVTEEPIPVTPAQHYLMGGVEADIFGRTSMKNLFAIGETACNGVHGANRLASNSLLESVVFAENMAGLIGRETRPGDAREAAVRMKRSAGSFAGAGSSLFGIPSPEEAAASYKEENRELILHEIRKNGDAFYAKWSNI